MGKILLDYVFPISVITPTPEASTAFLKQVCVVAKPKSPAVAGSTLYTCNSMSDVAAKTDNTDAQQLFNAGMSKVYLLLADDLDLTAGMAVNINKFFTVLISSDFDDTDIGTASNDPVKASKKIQDILYTAKTGGLAGNDISITYTDDGTGGSETVDVVGSAIEVHMEAGVSTAQQIADAIAGEPAADALVDTAVDEGDEDDVQSAQVLTSLENGAGATAGLQLGIFQGVCGISSADTDFLATQAAIENRCAFFKKSANANKSLFYAFGKLLSNQLDWLNQQYVSMPVDDEVATLGAAESLFDDKVSFVISDDEFSTRLALFAAGGKAIVAPYIIKNLKIDLASRALNWISANEPSFTKVNAALLEQRLDEDVIKVYILDHKWIEAGTVEVSLIEDNFVANGVIDIAEPKALWRVFGELRQTL